MTTTHLLEAHRLGYQVSKLLPPLMAKAVGDQLNWAAEFSYLDGGQYPALSGEVRRFIADNDSSAVAA